MRPPNDSQLDLQLGENGIYLSEDTTTGHADMAQLTAINRMK